ncbi:TetR/AcrR family transcriptional regulator [Fructobacillus tropaeoli]|uniref:AcrR family n=1 Tax=Fructobacillus tropaeoli TaxID=709323 RepID=A0A3F3H215_9LACO|nr:TetR/AcrR family transcriptional regulator [Fructobacillus tropaeoli]CAK1240313.1 AcrR family [Fructobacillus tropaeoli]CAK1246169.1 AcrR family [Fructobacillus tropaeoli]CAK1246744.1 AcrR family [Fructobacillus tropaeoli]GAP04614.1 TetR protein [Fructobacillus tropaeoli]GIC70648.1 TetR/AcrR family transcriptional regulator [Fructobacillus tropaeoli]
MKTDARYTKADAAIRATFLEILAHKDFHKISVQEIIKQADINRSTFYAHFLDKDDLMETIQMDLLEETMGALPSLNIENFDVAEIFQHRADFLVQKLYEQKELAALLLSKHAEHSFENRMVEQAKKAFFNTTDGHDLAIPPRYALNILTGTATNLIITWIRSGFQESTEEFSAILVKVVPPLLTKVIHAQN